MNFIKLSVVFAILASSKSFAQSSGTPWPATDALRRTLPLACEVGEPKKERFVGIFYFLWLNERHNKSPQGDHPFDISKIMAADPEALKKPDSPLWGSMGRAHYWGESIYGYYNSDDPWVIRRHAMLLSDAGVDTLIFDTTNRATYKPVYMKLCEVFTQIRKEGGRTPQIAFMVNTQARETADEIYRDLYEPGLYRELWFQWEGKPLLVCDPNLASDDVRKFFTLRRAHWPFTMENTDRAWHWEATYPQPFGYVGDAKTPEQVNVSVAQNLGAYGEHSVQNMSSGKARGRGFHNGRQDASADAIARGANFAEQWKRAYELDPPFVMVTGWNEWIAGRFERPGEPVAFVDQFDQEFSRDIEPVKGLHGDNFYYQLVDGIRRYKGAPALPTASSPKTISLTDGFSQWDGVTPEFLDHVGETANRDHPGAAGLRYKGATGRNDLVSMKVARDVNNVYFYVRAKVPTTPAGSVGSPPVNLTLFIDADQNPKTGWEGFDYIVNRITQDGTSVIEKCEGGWQWSPVANVESSCTGAELQLSIPRSALDLAHPTSMSFDFKWADNLQHAGDVMDFYLSGDVAPEGRFKYRYDAR